jgi:hypothetical protein
MRAGVRVGLIVLEEGSGEPGVGIGACAGKHGLPGLASIRASARSIIGPVNLKNVPVFTDKIQTSQTDNFQISGKTVYKYSVVVQRLVNFSTTSSIHRDIGVCSEASAELSL